MATTIRLTRMGRKKRPFYRMVVLDSRKRRDGAYLANLGYYNPFIEPHEVDLRHDEIIDWLGKGATMSETARALLRAEGILYRWSLLKAGMDEAEVATKVEEFRSASEDRKVKMAEAAAAKKAAAAKALEDAARAEAEAKAKAEEEAAAAAAAEAKAAEEAAAAEAAAEEAGDDAGEEAAEAASDDAPAEEAAEEAPTEDEETKKDSDGEGES